MKVYLTTVHAVFLLLLCHAHARPGAQPRPSTCTQEGKTQCSTTPPYNTPKITTDAKFRYVATVGCPQYPNPGWTNPSQACEFPRTYKLPLVPRKANSAIPVGEKLVVYENITYLKEEPAPVLGGMGVLKNGVDVFGVGSPCGYSSKCPEQGGPSKYVDAVEAEGHTVDTCGGHAAPTHQYHLHSGVGMTTNQLRESCELPTDVAGQHSSLLGWMFDGYGLYGRYSLNGTLPTNLDACGGHTHLLDGVETYHYHMPEGFPWTIGCFTGCPEISNNPREFSFTTSSPYNC